MSADPAALARKIVRTFVRGKNPLETHADMVAAIVRAIEAYGTARYREGLQAGADQMREWSPMLNDLRDAGWSVAAHNDYRLNGESFTFWLLTHPNGRWLKGEGRTDGEALDAVRIAALPREGQPTPDSRDGR